MTRGESSAGRRMVIGIGNPDRGDDGAGRLAARLLRDKVPDDVLVEEQDGNAASLIERLREMECVWLIDAVASGAPVGSIHRVDCAAAAEALPARAGASSHGLGVAEAIALARTLHGLPRVCVLYAVEGADFSLDAGVSSEVLVGAALVAARLAVEVRGG